MTHGFRRGAAMATGLILVAAGAMAGPSDRVLRACAPGYGADPAATLVAEGWSVLGIASLPAVIDRLSLASLAAEVANARTDLVTYNPDQSQRGVRSIADNARPPMTTTYLVPGDGTSLAQITISEGNQRFLYCMISTRESGEAADIARALFALAAEDRIERHDGIAMAKVEPSSAPEATDVSATPLPASAQVIQIDPVVFAAGRGAQPDADLFISGFWLGAR